jgi:serine/threonine-protein kinase
MKCQNCGRALPPEVRLCPNCGTLQRATRPARRLAQTQPQPRIPQIAPQPRVARIRSEPRVSSGRLRRLGLALAVVAGLACALLAILAGFGYAGLQAGMDDRLARLAQEADKYFQQGLDDLAADRLELAEADFAYVLQIDLDYPNAAQYLNEVRQMRADRERVVPTPTTSLADAIRSVFDTAQQAYAAEDWPTAIARLTQVRGLDPAFEAQAVADMLFNASYTYGLQLLEQDRLEEGLFHLEQAAALRPLDENATLQAEYAKLYLDALGYWNVNWERAIERFGELFNLAPGYKDTFDRYVRAYILYADSYVARADYCPAQPLYQQAHALRPDPGVQTKLDDAAAQCLTATPVALTGTLPISGTPVAVPGINLGRLAYPVFDEATGAYTIYALSPGSSPFAAAGGGQPAWQPTGPSLAYRVLGVGVNVIDLSTGQAASVASAGSAWPSWSPDGTRIVYAQRDAADNFRLIIATLDGSALPIDLGPGKSPVWGPTGLLAYAGCDAGGCGITIDNPDDPGPPVRLTASANDTPTAWSPDGANVAYYSDADGDWDVYFVNTSGGVQQIVNSPGDDGLPAWSPDGAHLAFVSNRDGAWAIYIVNFDGSELVKAIELGPENPNWLNERLAWAP